MNWNWRDKNSNRSLDPRHGTPASAFAGCAALLRAMGGSGEAIESDLSALVGRYGLASLGVGGRGTDEPSAKLRPVLEEIMRDPSKIQEIAERLQREDPALFMELMAFIQSQQE